MKTMCNVMGLLVAGMAVSACATEDGATEDTELQPIAEVPLASGSVVSFYETSPGSITISELTKINVPPTSTAGKSAVEVFRSIAPGEAVPAALLAAQERSDVARRGQPARQVPPRPAQDGIESFTASWFNSTYCQMGGYYFYACHLGTNNGGVKIELDETHYDIDEAFAAVCVNSGKVEFRVWEDGDIHLDAQLFGGDCKWLHHTTGLFNDDSFRVRTDILSSSANYFSTVQWNH